MAPLGGRLGRTALLALGGAALMTGMWAGLQRLGLVSGGPAVAVQHGPLMVSGFLGTVLSLERAVALGKNWAAVVPAMAGLGAVALIAGHPDLGLLAASAAGLGLVALFVILSRREPAPHMAVMGLGAVSWLAGSAALLAGQPMAVAAWLWAGFLVLTIVGERMELNRVRRLPRLGTIALGLVVVATVAALVALPFAPELAGRALGACLLGAAVWLLTFDVARRTVRSRGLTRFVAVCLLSGFLWLGVAGLLLLVHGLQYVGLLYDAQLHAVFVGFVLAMIFGHAPVVFPAVLMLPLRYRPVAYLPLWVLHGALIARVAGDLLGEPSLRVAGSVGNVVAILLFVVLQMFSALSGRTKG